MPELNKHFDFMNVMTYDYHGYWKDREEWDHREFTGHNAPLISREEEMSAGESSPGYLYNAFDTINLYIDGGMDRSKLVLGMPLYGRGFELVDPVSPRYNLLTSKTCNKSNQRVQEFGLSV